jgi:hypothetical protein
MSINVGKIGAPKTLNVSSFESENENDFSISHNSFYEKPSEAKEDLGLDFLTTNEPSENGSDQEQSEQEEETDDPINCEPNYADNEENYEETKQKKAFALYNLNRYRKQGYELSRNFGAGHSLEELETELTRIETEKDLDNGLNTCKDGLLIFTKALETANNVYGRDYIKLNGWTEFVSNEYKTHKYDDVFLKLWKKYGSKVSVGPEMTLLWLLGSSAFVFHLSKIEAEKEMARREMMGNTNRNNNNIPEMSEPSMNFDDFSDGSDTDSNVSDGSNGNGISISIPEPIKKVAKKRGRPSKK